MKVTWNWLAEFVDMALPLEGLVERLTLAGFEVEGVEPRGQSVADVVCAQIVRVTPHPTTPRLSLCDLRFGGDAAATVVCGAPNLRAGERVAYAPPGATLPDGRCLGVAEIDGVRSAGMLCSAAELQLGTDAAGLLVLPADAALGARVAAVLGIEDTVLDVAVSPNRGDCLSILGMAREIAALTGQRLRRQRIAVRESGPAAAELLDIRVVDADLCGRYVGRAVVDVKVAASPPWMQARLQAVGLRPINNVVDVTNYVMIERGQPLHAFDYDRLPQHQIVVRRAGRAERLVTLDGQARALEAGDLLIASGEVPVALAGVMGGAATEVSARTRRVLLESAWFAPGTVRRTARRLGLRTEAAYRFERTIDIDGAASAADRAAALIARLCGGSVARGRIDVYPGAGRNPTITLRLRRVDELLGMSVSRAEVVSRLKALGVGVVPGARGALTAVPPSYRADLTREIDLIEEIARLGGYESVPATLPQCALSGGGIEPAARRQRDCKRLLAAQGLHEAVLLSFCSSRLNALFPGLQPRPAVRILNPLSEDENELRLSLCPGLLRVLRDNLDRGAPQVAAFAIGKVFWREQGFGEGLRIAAVLSRQLPGQGLGSRGTVTEFVDLKGVAETVLDAFGAGDVRWTAAVDSKGFHPGKTARIEHRGTVLGIAGCVHPEVREELGIAEPCWLFELDLEKLLEYCSLWGVYQDLPRFPAVVRDLAVVTEESFASDQVVRFVRQWSKTIPLVEDVYLFDQYTGPPIPVGKKSLAYSIAYRAPDRTLTDAEVNEMHEQLIVALGGALPVEPR